MDAQLPRTIDDLLARFPKSRPPLSPAMQAVWTDTYKDNREGEGAVAKLSARLESWMHRRVAAREGEPILEIGAGTLNHVRYEPAGAAYDIVEPEAAFYEGKAEFAAVRNRYRNISEIGAEERYERIITIAALEHLTDLPACLAHAGLRLADGGVLQAGIPSESGFLWGFAWRSTTALAFRLRTGLDWGEHMRHEHINTAPEIIALIEHFFGRVKLARFPLPFHHLSLYCYIEAADPRLERCRSYLD